MRELVLSSMAVATVVAGVMGFQSMRSSDPASAQVSTPAKTIDDDGVTPNPVVVELFTSQGCSSCPPADRLASRLAKDDSLLVISRPVTYWDRLGWKDTLAREENTQLQRSYARKGNAGSGVYTPQIVINGRDGAVGSREQEIRSLVRVAKDGAGPLIEQALLSNGDVEISIGGKSDHMSSVSLLALSSSETVRIGRGENGGRTVHYTNVVKDERRLGSWQGEPMQFTIPKENLRIGGADKYAIVMQRPGAGAIVGAKLLDI